MGNECSPPALPEGAGVSPAAETASATADKVALLSAVIVAAVASAGVVVCVAAVKRGFDLTDESDYIFSAQHSRAFLRSSTEFQLLLSPMLSIVKRDWILRVVKVVGLLGAHAFFAGCFLTTAPSLIGARFKRFDRLAAGAAITVGALGVSRVLGQTPGYNDLTIFIEVTVSGLFLLLAAERVPRRAELPAWFAVGMLIWFQLVVRWPSTISLVPLAAITLFWTGHRPMQLLRYCAAALAGGAVCALATQLFLAPVPDIVNGIRQGNADASAALGHDRGHLLRQYETNLADLARAMTHNFWYLLAAAVAVGLLLGARRYALPVAVTAASGLVLLTPLFVLSGRARGGVAPYGGPGLTQLLERSLIVPLYVVLAILVGAAAFVTRPETRPTLRSLAVIASLLAAPFLSALGTNNPIWFNASLLPVFWVSAALALACLAHRHLGRWLVHGLAFAFASVIAFTAFDGTWRHPYQQPPLARATTAVSSSGPLDGLRVDAATAVVLQQVRATTDAFRASSPPPNMLVWAPGLPGASVAADLEQPLFAWLAQPYIARISLTAACEEHGRGILLFQYSNQPANINGDPGLAAACSGRTWTQRASISNGMTAWYAGPSG